MKECPVCAASTFDDMDKCYSCLHVFSAEETGAVSIGDVPADPGAAAEPVAAANPDVGTSALARETSSLQCCEAKEAQEPSSTPAVAIASSQMPKRYRLELTLVPVDRAL